MCKNELLENSGTKNELFKVQGRKTKLMYSLGTKTMLGNLWDTKEIQGFEAHRIAVFKTRFAPSPMRLLRVLANSLQDTTKPKSK